MKRSTKLAIYNVIYWILRVIEIPFYVFLMLIGLWYYCVWEQLDDILLSWVESNNEKEK